MPVDLATADSSGVIVLTMYYNILNSNLLIKIRYVLEVDRT
jgi:hypothetical protein